MTFAEAAPELAVLALFALLWAWTAVDCLRAGSPRPWIWVILFLPVAGAPLYLLLHTLPRLRDRLVADPRRTRELAERADNLGHPSARRDLGHDLFRRRRYEEARSEFERSLRNDPDNTGACYMVALCLREQGHVAEALPWLERVLARDDDFRYGEAQSLFADLLLKAGREDEALRALVEVVERHPTAEREFTLIKLLLSRGERDRALRVFEDMERSTDPHDREETAFLEKARRAVGGGADGPPAPRE